MLLAGSTSLLHSVRRDCKQLRLLACIGLSEPISRLTRCGCRQSAMRRFQSQVVCFSITCNPLTTDDQLTTEMTP